tara:strand:+ start:387 stop:749 length:363 start_codon:yes stop_codon:yes gene_type:complete
MKLTEKLNKIWSKMTTVKATAKNYTDEQVAHMVEVYSANPTRDTVDVLAQELGKSVRSIIAKLSREGVYIAQERKTKSGEPVVRKADLVSQLESHFDSELPSLVKASKADLTFLVETITQ